MSELIGPRTKQIFLAHITSISMKREMLNLPIMIKENKT
jgi:hypothetical protein